MPASAASSPPASGSAEDLATIEAMLGTRIDSAERVGAGRNSRVYKVRRGADEYAAKFYFKPTADGRDRLQIEFNGLGFLWRRGVRDIAEPLLSDRERQVALYRFIPGTTVLAVDAGDADVDQLVAFVGALRAIPRDAESLKIGPAAEAFFSAEGVVANVAQRLSRLQELDPRGGAYEDLRGFLRDQFVPAFDSFSAVASSGAGSELPAERRTLSPSDLGFHNSLRRPDGRLSFLDFEYFGWDDPAKTISDCVLHPMMGMPEPRKRRLAVGFDRIFGDSPGWRARVDALYPMFALKWCMIMLNEFRRDQIERRQYVDRQAEEIEVIQRRQLAAARALLERTTQVGGKFPHWEATA